MTSRNTLRLKARTFRRRITSFPPFRSRVLWAAIALVFVGFACFWWQWDNFHQGLKEPNITVVTGMGALLGGSLAILLTTWRSLVGAQQMNTAQRVLFNDIFQRGAEMLGHQTLVVRLGGIYALQRLAEERSYEYYSPVMNLLCAFVRTAPWPDGPKDEQGLPIFRVPIQTDAQQAIVAIGERRGRGLTTEGEPYFRLNLSGSNLRSAVLNGLNLSSTQTSSRAVGPLNRFLQSPSGTDLGGADLRGASMIFTVLSDVDFSGGGSNPAQGLTLSQLQAAWWEPDRPPNLEGVRDVISGRSVQEELDRVRDSEP